MGTMNNPQPMPKSPRMMVNGVLVSVSKPRANAELAMSKAPMGIRPYSIFPRESLPAMTLPRPMPRLSAAWRPACSVGLRWKCF